MDEFLQTNAYVIYHYGIALYFGIMTVIGIAIIILFKNKAKRVWLLGCVIACLLVSVFTLVTRFPLRPIIESSARIQGLMSEKLPDFEFDNLRIGTRERISDFRGKVIILNFWGTYCRPCIEELPTLVKVARDFKDDVVVLAISDEPEERIKKFMSRHDMPEKVCRFSSVKRIELEDFRPVTVMVDRYGNVSSYTIGKKDYAFFASTISELIHSPDTKH